MFILPIKRDFSSSHTAWVVYSLIAANIVIMLGTVPTNAFLQEYGFVASKHELITIFTSMFLHADPMHLLGNMIFLWIFGESVEDSLGHLLTFVGYLLCGIGATALQYAGDPQSSIPCIGASGAISGIMAIYVVLYFNVKMDIVVFVWYFELVTIPANALVAGVVWVAEQSLLWLLQSSTGISFGIAFLAHVGGFVSGVGIAVVFSVLRLLKSQENKPQSPIRCPACQTQMNHWKPGRARCWSCRARILIDKDGIVLTR